MSQSHLFLMLTVENRVPGLTPSKESWVTFIRKPAVRAGSCFRPYSAEVLHDCYARWGRSFTAFPSARSRPGGGWHSESLGPGDIGMNCKLLKQVRLFSSFRTLLA